MPKIVTPQPGDTLCSIAARHGFAHCDRLRSEAANASLLKKRLDAKDRVTVPDLEVKKEAGKATEEKHTFKRPGVPIPSVRFVHGSADKSAEDDETLRELHVSNFVSDKGGADGKSAFPATYGFSKDGHADPDSFKVEVTDPGATGTVDVTLEALKPLYDAKGKLTAHEPFKAPELARRSAKATCESVGAKSVRYRSKYLRLVVDAEDKTALGDQGLLVTDMADGKAGANDAVEILDQKVRASYVLEICKAKSDKCTAVAELPIGKERRRVHLCFHVYRTAVGDKTGVRGTTAEMIRKRTGRWFRRLYAQAGISYRFVDPHVEFVDPPSANMLVLSEIHGNATTGGSELTFSLATEDEWAKGAAGTKVTVPLPAKKTPVDVGKLVIAALPKAYSGKPFPNPLSIGSANPSCDVLIESAGKRVRIRFEGTTDATLGVRVARVQLSAVDDTINGKAIPATNPEMRRLIRGAPGSDQRLDFYVLEAFTAPRLRGVAFPPLALWGANQNVAPLRYSVLLASHPPGEAKPFLDLADHGFVTLPHEAGHVLTDAFHARTPAGNTEMMRSGTDPVNAVDGSKRICDAPILLEYQLPRSAKEGLTAAVSKDRKVSAVRRIYMSSALFLKDW